MGEKSVYLKKDCFYIGELNYYSIMKIIKIMNPQLYDELLLNKEFSRYAINCIIKENQKESPSKIIDYILNKTSIELLSRGKDYQAYLFDFLKNQDFVIDKYKAFIYDDLNIDYKFIFNQFEEIKVLFVYDIHSGKLKIITRKGIVIKEKKIEESDAYVKFENFTEKQIKEDTDDFFNKLLKEIMAKLFDLEKFFQDFKEEIYYRILNILGMMDISDENMELLRMYEEQEGFGDEIGKAIANILNKRDKKLSSKYGIKL